jgi:hypothetical protein
MKTEEVKETVELIARSNKLMESGFSFSPDKVCLGVQPYANGATYELLQDIFNRAIPQSRQNIGHAEVVLGVIPLDDGTEIPYQFEIWAD